MSASSRSSSRFSSDVSRHRWLRAHTHNRWNITSPINRGNYLARARKRSTILWRKEKKEGYPSPIEACAPWQSDTYNQGRLHAPGQPYLLLPSRASFSTHGHPHVPWFMQAQEERQLEVLRGPVPNTAANKAIGRRHSMGTIIQRVWIHLNKREPECGCIQDSSSQFASIPGVTGSVT